MVGAHGCTGKPRESISIHGISSSQFSSALIYTPANLLITKQPRHLQKIILKRSKWYQKKSLSTKNCMATKIRLVKKEDLKKLAEIYAKTYEAFNIGEDWNRKSAYKMLEFWFKRQPGLFFVAEYNKKIVGAFATCVKPWWDGNHLSDGEIFVHPDFQSKGIGSALIKKLFKTAKTKYKSGIEIHHIM